MIKNKYLQHHGIKGMKWGVRRYQNEDGTLTDAGKKRYDRDNRKEAKAQKHLDDKNRTILSDAELASAIKRLQMEKQLHDLTKTEVDEGHEYVKGIMKDIGKKVLTTAASGALLYAGKAAILGEFNVKELGAAVFNGGAKKK